MEQVRDIDAARGADRYRSQVAEVINRNTIVSLAMAAGYNAFLPAYDGGVDFILYREFDGELRKVQLKSRWTIDRKYLGRDIWVAFPLGEDWYLMPHDEMVGIAGTHGFAETRSWVEGGKYTVPRPSKALAEACAPWRFTNPAGMIAAAADVVSNETGDA